ncbi:MAG: arylesterase [Gemmatimonadales bacterium]
MIRKILTATTVLAVSAACRGGDSAPATVRENRIPTASDSRPVVLFLGTSLTAGYGLSAGEAYPSLIQQKIDSVGLGFRVVNAGESGGTSAGGVRRIGWLLRQPLAALVLELGANDGLRGQDLANLKRNLQTIIDTTLATYPEVEIVIAGMEAPPNLGQRYTAGFRQVFQELAEENGVGLIPFILEGVAGLPELNQADGIHPTEAGQRLMAETVWEVLEPRLEQITPAESP